jgi:hypothetical protein
VTFRTSEDAVQSAEYLVCSRCGARSRSGLARGGGRYLLRPCGHVARMETRPLSAARPLPDGSTTDTYRAANDRIVPK